MLSELGRPDRARRKPRAVPHTHRAAAAPLAHVRSKWEAGTEKRRGLCRSVVWDDTARGAQARETYAENVGHLFHEKLRVNINCDTTEPIAC